MNTPNTKDQPAFPVPGHQMSQLESGHVMWTSHPGMTLRQYYAGQAMLGIVSTCDECDSPIEMARASVIIADALIAELEK